MRHAGGDVRGDVYDQLGWLVLSYQAGLHASAVLGCEPRVVQGRLAPELARPVLAGNAKVEAFRAHTQAPVLAAFGDDVRDLPLLSLGRLRVGVWPTAELIARADECGGLQILHCG